MRDNYVVKDGQLRWWVLVLFMVSGIGLIFFAAVFGFSYFTRTVLSGFGLFLMAVAGYSGQSSALRLRPFDNAPWRRVRKNYSEEKAFSSVVDKE